MYLRLVDTQVIHFIAKFTKNRINREGVFCALQYSFERQKTIGENKYAENKAVQKTTVKNKQKK